MIILRFHLNSVSLLKVAKIIEVPPIRVYEVATFYSMFNRTKVPFNLQTGYKMCNMLDILGEFLNS